MHVIDATERFTLLGSNARRGKITLFDAEGPRERGALEHVALPRVRVSTRRWRAAGGLELERPRAGEAYFDVGARACGSGSSRRRPTSTTTSTTSRSSRANPEETAGEYGSLGFAPRRAGPSGAPRVEVGGAWVEFQPASRARRTSRCSTTSPSSSSRPTSTSPPRTTSASRSTTSSTPRTRYAVFLWGPERVRIEYVEHKPTFSLT